jgi:hypothetical protein
LPVKPPAYLGDELRAVHVAGQIIVGQDEIRTHRSVFNFVQRRGAIGYRYRVVAFIFEVECEKFADFGVILHDHDRAGMMCSFQDFVVDDVLMEVRHEANFAWCELYLD